MMRYHNHQTQTAKISRSNLVTAALIVIAVGCMLSNVGHCNRYVVKVEAEEDEEEAFPACLDRSVSILCHAQYPGTDDRGRSSRRECLRRPRGVFASAAAANGTSSSSTTQPRPSLLLSPEQAEARRLLMMHGIQAVSIGSTKIGLCDEVLKNKRTLCTNRNELDLFEFTSWVKLFGGGGAAGGGSGDLRGNINDQDSSSVAKGTTAPAQPPPPAPLHEPLLPSVLFTEHVLEHFEPTQVQLIAAAAFGSLRPGGAFRVAVPDGYKPSPSYHLYVRPGSTQSGLGQAHMVSWTVDNLVPIFEKVGFEVTANEYFDDRGNFHNSTVGYRNDERYGKVFRTARHDGRNRLDPKRIWKQPGLGTLLPDTRPDEPRYTSLWFDAVKPIQCQGAVL